MKHIAPQPLNPVIATIHQLGIRNQQLLTRSLDLKRLDIARELKAIDAELCMLLNVKELGGSTRYIWRTQGDDKVRSAHAANSGKIFLWDAPPATGHPGEGFNCRCWAEPVGAEEYARQTLISSVNDNADKWTNSDFWNHYRNGMHTPVTLQQTGYLTEIVNYYENHALASDGKPGVYRAVNEQIIEQARLTKDGHFQYLFGTSYNFYNILYTFRNSVVKGVFEGDVRREREFLVINGIITYNFSDEFADIFTLVEIQQRLGIERGIAEDRVRNIDEALGDVYAITDIWKTKFNATVKIAQ